MSPRSVLTRLATVGVLAAAALTLPAAAAQATPTGCSAWTLYNVGYASCTGGTGTVRVAVICASFDGTEGSRQGPATAPGGVSQVKCPASWHVQDVWYVTAG